MENIQERDAELRAIYRKFMHEVNVTHAEAVKAAVNSPASRYWVSPSYLYREILRRKAGKTTSVRRPYGKTAVYDQLYSDYLTIRNNTLYKDMPLQMLCDLLVARPAPRFFLSEKRASEVVRKLTVDS